MINAEDLIADFDNRTLPEMIIDMVRFFYPEKMENYNLEIYTISTLLNTHEKTKKLCIVLKDEDNTIESELRIYISKKRNNITFKRYNFPKGHKIIDNHVPLEKINNIDDLYITLYENIIITE